MALIDASSDRSGIGLDDVRRPTIDRMQGVGPALYIALGALLFVAMVSHTLNENWASPDFWVHLGAIREFADHPVDPGHPLVVGDDADPYLSPYTWVLGAISRLTGVGALEVLAMAGLASLVVLLIGVYRLVTTFSSRPLAPPLALVFTLFGWGLGPWRWSGFFSANSIGSSLPLASTIATGLACLALSATVRWLRTGERRELALVAVAVPLIITCHPFTASWTAALGLGFVGGTADAQNRRRTLALAVVVAGSAALALAWPFYPVADLPGTSDAFEATNSAMFHNVLPRTFLALPGVVAIWLRLRQRRRDPIVLGFTFAAAVYAAGWLLDRPTLGRVLPAVVLMLHVALADVVAGVAQDPAGGRRRSAVLAVVALGVAVGMAGTAVGMIRAVPRPLLLGLSDHRALASLVDRYRPIGDRIARDEVIVASEPLALGSSAIGGKAIVPAAPAPFIDDLTERERATKTILDPETPAARRSRELDRYDVAWLVLTPRAADRLREAGAFVDGSVVVEYEASTFALAKVDVGMVSDRGGTSQGSDAETSVSS